MPSTASAASNQESVFQDDRLLVYSDADTRRATLDELKSLGADSIRVLVVWKRLAPSPSATTKPDFNAADPRAYSDWGPYDDLVREAAARGIAVQLNPSGPAPAWASACRGSVATRQKCRPRADEFGNFVRALGTRYSGSFDAAAAPAPAPGGYADPLPIDTPAATAAAVLPRVTRWSLWNEPNHAGWLTPQKSAPRIYRDLALAGLKALSDTGHGSDLNLIGETAPVGARHTTAPVTFYRELFCLSRSLRPYRGREARKRGCSGAGRIPASAISHHPYTLGASAAPSQKGRSTDVPIGALTRLNRVLDRAARYKRFRSRSKIYLTEFGFQTNPPDPFTRVTPSRQAEYLNYADYVAFTNRRVASVAQYELRDEADPRAFNTGLRFNDGRAKPSLNAWATPLYVDRRGSRVRVFGQARPEANGTGVTVLVRNRRSGSRRWRTVATVKTNGSGYLLKSLGYRSGKWQLVWRSAAGKRYASRVAVAR